MPLTISPTGRVTHVAPTRRISKDAVPHRREVEQALAVLRERTGPECREALNTITRALTIKEQ